jgi:hypothetical protein
MQKILLLLLLSASLFSCVTEKQRLKICNNCALKAEVHDSIYQVECWDTVRLPPISGPMILIQNPCDNIGHLKPISITQTKNAVKGTVKSFGNSLVFTCDTDSLKAYIKTLTEKYVSNKKVEENVKYIPCKDERTRFDGFTFWWFWITLVLIIIAAVLFYFKHLIKIPF